MFYREENGEYKKLKNFNKAWRVVCEKAGLDDLRFHDLRHVSATELVKLNIPERQIMDVAGWKTPMLSTYRHKNSLKSAQKINASFRNQGSPADYSSVVNQ